MLDPDADSAKSLTFAAIIVQIAFMGIGVVFALVFLTLFLPLSTPAALSGLGFIVTMIAIMFVFWLFWILLDYYLVYVKIAEERVSEAETPSLVLGIIQLLLSIVPGILLIIAYAKIRDSMARYPAHYVQPRAPAQPPRGP